MKNMGLSLEKRCQIQPQFVSFQSNKGHQCNWAIIWNMLYWEAPFKILEH